MTGIVVEKQLVKQEQLKFYTENFEQLCRLCLSPVRLVSIYSDVQGPDECYVHSFVKLAFEILSVKISKHDRLPNFICEQCEKNLCFIVNFRTKCNKSFAILQDVSDNICKRNDAEAGSEIQEIIDRKPKQPRRSKWRPTSKQRAIEEALSKLPAVINVEKVTIGTPEKCSTEQKPGVTARQAISTTQEEAAVEPDEPHDLLEARVDHEEIVLLEVVDEMHDQEQKKEPFVQDDSLSSRKIETASKELENSLLNDKNELIELLEVDESQIEAEKGKTSKVRKRITCSICGAMVNNISAHLITHSDVRPHRCEQCPKSFATRNKLRLHTDTVHLRKRDFECDICGKAFLELNHLKGHMRIHKGDRKYACDVCPKSFLFAGTLRCHKLTHTQEKKHACQTCGKLFLLKTTLNKHFLVHTDERRHKCELCDKRFRTSTQKVVHMRTHTGEKPLVCYICDMSFAHHKGRSVHMKSKHFNELMRMGLIDDKGHIRRE